MKKFKISLYGKMLILAAALQIIMVVIVLVGFRTFEVLNDRDNLRNVATLMLEIYQHRSEFSKKREMQYVDSVSQNVEKIGQILEPYSLEPTVNKLLIMQNDYIQSFKRYVELMKERGLDENLGKEGIFRESVHEIEDIIKENQQNKIYIQMLQARRREKDYIMRRDLKYTKYVENHIDTLVNVAASMDVDPYAKADIIKKSQVYLLNFIELTRVFQSLDQMEIKLEEYELNIQQLLRNIVDRKAQDADTWQTSQIYIIIFSILFSIGLSIFIAYTITKPVTKLKKAAHDISQGDYDATVVINSNDEIGDLAKSFNLMVENLRQSNNTIMEQQEKVKDKNVELELLAEDLQASFNSLSVLSDIGQSITSTLNFEELFTKLYKNLTYIVENSTFGIATFDKEEAIIKYKLVIRNSEQQKGFQLNLDQEYRLDVISIKFKQEIFIDDISDNFEQLQMEYPWLENAEQIQGIEKNPVSVIYIPIKIENEVIGILSIENEKKKTWKSHDLDLLRNLASYIAIAMLNIKSFEEVTRSHEKLQKAQSQLIQAEKLASLGQLTTGIAHEIKNPLNFINNYSDGTNELIQEIIEEFETDVKGKIDEKDFNYFLETFTEMSGHLETIANNGKRVDRIVKSMMEHARGSSGEKIDTNINTFVSEYMKLSYNGFRGQYKSFTCTFDHQFDPTEPRVLIRQQDISRVLTNIIDNACYSTMKKQENNPNGYQPYIIGFTKDLGDKVEIRIRDNGLGVPQKVIDKIFNPFFTTKPTGEGTGLGLSLSYDIITNGHNGEMKVETKEGEYAEFIIVIPKESIDED